MNFIWCIIYHYLNIYCTINKSDLVLVLNSAPLCRFSTGFLVQVDLITNSIRSSLISYWHRSANRHMLLK